MARAIIIHIMNIMMIFHDRRSHFGLGRATKLITLFIEPLSRTKGSSPASTPNLSKPPGSLTAVSTLVAELARPRPVLGCSDRPRSVAAPVLSGPTLGLPARCPFSKGTLRQAHQVFSSLVCLKTASAVHPAALPKTASER